MTLLNVENTFFIRNLHNIFLTYQQIKDVLVSRDFLLTELGTFEPNPRFNNGLASYNSNKYNTENQWRTQKLYLRGTGLESLPTEVYGVWNK